MLRPGAREYTGGGKTGGGEDTGKERMREREREKAFVVCCTQ